MDPNQSASQQPTEQSAPQTPTAPAAPNTVIKKKNSKLPLILIAILVLVILQVGGYLLLNKYQGMKETPQKSENAKVIPTAEVAPTEQPVPAIPAEWKTYESAQYGMSFKYPQNWRIADPYSGNYFGKTTAEDYVGLIPADKEKGDSVSPIYVERLKNPKNLSLQEYEAEVNKEIAKTGGIEQHYYPSQAENITVGGYPAYSNMGCGEPSPCDKVTVPAKDNIYIFYNVHLEQGQYTDQELAANKVIFDQIISSITFPTK